MQLINRLPGSTRTPPGREPDVVRRLPGLLVLGTHAPD